MGYRTISLQLPTDYSEEQLRHMIQKNAGTNDFTFQIDKKSLDARKKDHIHWLLNCVVSSPDFSGETYPEPETLDIPRHDRKEQVVVVGSGPAGFFSAYVLLKAGFKVTLIERGSDVATRSHAIGELETRGLFSETDNYAFGEGGAGTFSDGKLTSRSKHISRERRFILTEYVKVGAPEEILYMAHPHLGTDNLKRMVENLRLRFEEEGGTFLFNTCLDDIRIRNGRVESVICGEREIKTDHVLIAAGHSAYDTYRMLIKRGVPFRTKQFAIGHRIEHPRTLVNRAQWGRDNLPGVKAAEYRLTTKVSSGRPVYTFCMCPGGQVVPAAAFSQHNVVNGMSHYRRDGYYSNAACVVGVHPDDLMGRICTPLEILEWMDRLEESFFDFADGYTIPALRAQDYMKRKQTERLPGSSYPLGVQPAALYDMVPKIISSALIEGLADMDRKLRGFDSGILMGLESKTSSPLQADRDETGRSTGFENLYIIGEGGGYAGGIISSAADGIRCAMHLCTTH